MSTALTRFISGTSGTRPSTFQFEILSGVITVASLFERSEPQADHLHGPKARYGGPINHIESLCALLCRETEIAQEGPDHRRIGRKSESSPDSINTEIIRPSADSSSAERAQH